MRTIDGKTVLSASDLGHFLSCRHLAALDLAVLQGLRAKPTPYPDPAFEALKQRGLEHEKAFVESQRALGKTVLDLGEQTDRAAKTIDAMKCGVDIIYQGELEHDGWRGYADIIRKIDKPSPNLGAWSYEVVDTKLARETKGTTILQLALYSEVVGTIQGEAPEYFYVVTPLAEERYRLSEYASYYHLVKRGLAAAIKGDPKLLMEANYPEPVEFCELCDYEPECDQRRRDDDHLSLVAGITRLQRRELVATGVATLASLAGTALPIKLKRGSEEGYARVREQARIQLSGREKDENVHEMIRPITAGEGLTILPAPSPRDIFLDLEGAHYAREDGGREYLFGLVTVRDDGKSEYRAFWATTDAEEKRAFEDAMDLIMTARAADETMHVYHYHHYEKTAFQRLMGRYATRQDDVDTLLRGGHLVDLHTVVKQSLRASVEGYSIKNLEVFYKFERATNLRVAGDRRAFIERCLESGQFDLITPEARALVQGYNEDDCLSTWKLRDWLEGLRTDLIAGGTEVPRPAPREAEPSEELTADQERVRALMEPLLAGLPVSARNRIEQARWILANLLEYHRREDKVSFWEKFRLQALALEDYFDEPRAIGGLERVERVKAATRKGGVHVDRYRYPAQDCDVHTKDELRVGEEKFGTVISQDRGARTLDVKKTQETNEQNPSHVFAYKHITADILKDALRRIAQAVVDSGCADAGPYRAAWSLVLNEAPRMSAGADVFAPRPGEAAVDFASRVVVALDGTVLPIQGPPGTGKTLTGARMICALLRASKVVGVTGPSHAVIDNLLLQVLKEAKLLGLDVMCGHKGDDDDDAPDGIEMFRSGPKALAALEAREIQVLGGTAWLWAAPGAERKLDVLVCDEAGQMCLANLLAASCAADSVVLLGDPQQLEQVQQGSHPDGTGVSALEHILGEHQTMPVDRGIFLDETWRMHPSICKFVSDVFYEGRLRSRARLERQVLSGTQRFNGAGLWMVGVQHDGNRNDSPEEVDAVEGIVRELLTPGSTWTDKNGDVAQITAADILVVSPYNRQVSELLQRLSPLGVRVGTVDKFQGQQAAVVIYSMASSTAADTSRGMEFLYNLNRMNVATSRARCATILVASPELFEPECHSPKQMKLANGLCRYVEMAAPVAI